MCLFCIEVSKKNMTPEEVARAYREFDATGDHFGDILVSISNNYDIDEVARELSKLYENDPG